MNNQMPGNFGMWNNNCRCAGEIREIQRRMINIENRINRLESAVFGNNWGNWGSFNNPSMSSNENREYTTGNYIL